MRQGSIIPIVITPIVIRHWICIIAIVIITCFWILKRKKSCYRVNFFSICATTSTK